jgi:hypothetical protein
MLKRFSCFLIFCGLSFFNSACGPESDKANVEEQNDDKFDDRHREREAQFIVDVLDSSYGILEVAQLGEEKGTDPATRGNAKRIIEAQTSMIVKLKAYAESHDISIPFSGPARTRRSVKKLHEQSREDFDAAWREELKKSAEKLSRKIGNYQTRRDSALTSVLDGSIEILNQHKEIISGS